MTSTMTLIDGRTKEYFTAAETAKLVRRALAQNFPGVKFAVRTSTYSGGASIRVLYDGLDHYTPLDSCYCSEGPLLRNGWSANQCGRCAFMRPLEPVYKPGMPTGEAVRNVVEPFAGSQFEGMIDLKYPVSHFLDDDGNVTGSQSAGSGIGPGWNHPGPGRLVHFGADYIFVEHELR